MTETCSRCKKLTNVSKIIMQTHVSMIQIDIEFKFNSDEIKFKLCKKCKDDLATVIKFWFERPMEIAKIEKLHISKIYEELLNIKPQ